MLVALLAACQFESTSALNIRARTPFGHRPVDGKRAKSSSAPDNLALTAAPTTSTGGKVVKYAFTITKWVAFLLPVLLVLSWLICFVLMQWPEAPRVDANAIVAEMTKELTDQIKWLQQIDNIESISERTIFSSNFVQKFYFPSLEIPKKSF